MLMEMTKPTAAPLLRMVLKKAVVIDEVIDDAVDQGAGIGRTAAVVVDQEISLLH